MRLHFDLALVQRLLDHSKAATERSPSFDQLYEGRFRHDGKDADLDNLCAGHFPTADDVDPAKVPPGLWLVGDAGIYLMSNGRPQLLANPATSQSVVAPAVEADPASGIGNWWEMKRAAFGGDDGVVFLDQAFAEGLIARGRHGRACVDLTPTHVEALAPAISLAVALPTTPSHRRRSPSPRAGRA